jgi:hypothetical protein
MKKGSVDARQIDEGSWGRRMVREQVPCQENAQI